MRVHKLESGGQKDQRELMKFLHACQKRAVETGHPQIASISLTVREMDPLAVWEAIYDPEEYHFYLEHPSEDIAVAAAGSVIETTATGPGRFQEIQEWSRSWLENTNVVGDWKQQGTGPTFFGGFTFEETQPGYSAFPPATAFLPKWQISRWKETFGAVANMLVQENSPLEMLAAKILGAHQKFYSFDYGESARSAGTSIPIKRADFSAEEEVRAVFESNVERALEAIAKGEIQKVVLARTQDIAADQPFLPPLLLDRLRKNYPTCHMFSLGKPGQVAFIGASPERLVRVQDGTLYTEAIAGTTPRSESPREDALLGSELLASDKDRREHKFVLDTLCECLERLGARPYVLPEPRLLRLSNVQHLWVPISVPAGDTPVLQWAEALQPTPAVGGIPRSLAIQRIEEWETQSRGLYAGSIGWWNARGEGEFIVGIRSALVKANHARLWAGAGIVEGSTPPSEFRETTAKIAALGNAFSRPFRA